jgi:hypothetical protein
MAVTTQIERRLTMQVRTLQDIAKEKNIQGGSLRNAIKNGTLKATKSGGTWLVDMADKEVIEYFKNFQHRENKPKGTCQMCGKPVPRARAKYCGQACYGKSLIEKVSQIDTDTTQAEKE